MKTTQILLALGGLVLLVVASVYAMDVAKDKKEDKDEDPGTGGTNGGLDRPDRPDISAVITDNRRTAPMPVALVRTTGTGGVIKTPTAQARNAGWQNFLCRLANADAGLLGYTRDDVRAHCAEYVLDGGNIHIT